MKTIVLGATGMLGHAVAEYLESIFGVAQVVRSARPGAVARSEGGQWFELALPVHSTQDLVVIPEDADCVINCIGTIIQQAQKTDVVELINVNAIFPHLLAEYCERNAIKLIHITTDCVFSGFESRPYLESDAHDAASTYGKSKSLGEPPGAMVLRTSIIGREIRGYVSLVEWVKQQAGKKIRGYTNHTWNGVTTRTFAKCCQKIIEQNLFSQGVYHVFSPETVTKYELVGMIAEALCINVEIDAFETNFPCYRNLGTEREMASKLEIPSLRKQLGEL